jgi:hypothetical protein
MIFDWIIRQIWAETTVGQNNIAKITFILDENVDKEFKSSIAIDLLWEKVELIKQFKQWDAVKAYLNFKANEYETKRYNRISAWKIEWASTNSTWAKKPAENKDDDLPF